MDFLEKRGVKCVKEDGFHYFPSSGRASDVLRALTDEAARLKIEIRCGTALKNIRVSDNKISAAEIAGGAILSCRALIIAGGGSARPELGSAGEAFCAGEKTRP